MSNSEANLAAVEEQRPPTLEEVEKWLGPFHTFVITKFGQIGASDLEPPSPPPTSSGEKEIEEWIMNFNAFVVETFARFGPPTTDEIEAWLKGMFSTTTERFARLGAPNFPNAGPPPVPKTIDGGN